MATILIYASPDPYLSKTIDDILDKTDPTDIDAIVVCNDSGQNEFQIDDPQVLISNTNKLGLSVAWNKGASLATDGSDLVFLYGCVKTTPDWLSELIEFLESHRKSIVSPIVHGLDQNFWSMMPEAQKRHGWRWDLRIHERQQVLGVDISPVASDQCLMIKREWFDHLGGFDEQLSAGEVFELSLRCWLYGGSVHVNDESVIAAPTKVRESNQSVANYAKIAETWCIPGVQHFYRNRKVNNQHKLTNLDKYKDRQVNSFKWYVQNVQPELGKIYDLRKSAHGKSIAVIGCGASLDEIDRSVIDRNDILIGADASGLLFNCDYVVVDSINLVTELRGRYSEWQFVLPLTLENSATWKLDLVANIMPQAIQFDTCQARDVITTLDTPFYRFENNVLTAIQFALLLEPKTITVYGFDNKIVKEKSHTSQLECYGDGKLWRSSESVRRRFALYENWFTQLGQLAANINVSLMRMNYA